MHTACWKLKPKCCKWWSDSDFSFEWEHENVCRRLMCCRVFDTDTRYICSGVGMKSAKKRTRHSMRSSSWCWFRTKSSWTNDEQSKCDIESDKMRRIGIGFKCCHCVLHFSRFHDCEHDDARCICCILFGHFVSLKIADGMWFIKHKLIFVTLSCDHFASDWCEQQQQQQQHLSSNGWVFARCRFCVPKIVSVHRDTMRSNDPVNFVENAQKSFRRRPELQMICGDVAKTKPTFIARNMINATFGKC